MVKIREELVIQNMYQDYLSGKKSFPNFQKSEGGSLANNVLGFTILTKEGKKMPEWYKKYSIYPHEKTHGRQSFSVGINTFVALFAGGDMSVLELVAYYEIEAYSVSILSLLEYYKTTVDEEETQCEK